MNNIVYVLLNEAMPNLVKIGRTNKDIKQRIKELGNTSTPLPFQCFYAAEVNDDMTVENRIHKIFLDKRLRSNREFFRVDPNQVVEAIKLAAIKEVTPTEDIVNELSDKAALKKYSNVIEYKNRITLKAIKVPDGATLKFSRDKRITCTVVDKTLNRVLFKGKNMSLSGAALKVLNSIGYNWVSARGINYWEYEEETLATRYSALEDST